MAVRLRSENPFDVNGKANYLISLDTKKYSAPACNQSQSIFGANTLSGVASSTLGSSQASSSSNSGGSFSAVA